MLVSRRPMPGSFAEVNLKEPEQALIVEPCFVNESAFGWLWFQATLAAVSVIWQIFVWQIGIGFPFFLDDGLLFGGELVEILVAVANFGPLCGR